MSSSLSKQQNSAVLERTHRARKGAETTYKSCAKENSHQQERKSRSLPRAATVTSFQREQDQEWLKWEAGVPSMASSQDHHYLDSPPEG
jgi:hypothetical protein